MKSYLKPKATPGWSKLFHQLAMSPKLKPIPYRILGAIKAHVNRFKRSCPSGELLMQYTGLSRNTVFKAIKELESLQIIIRSRNYNSSNTYTLIDEEWAEHQAKIQPKNQQKRSSKRRTTKRITPCDTIKNEYNNTLNGGNIINLPKTVNG